jgi:hypothetical protein
LLKEKETTGVISGFMVLRKDGKTARAADLEEALIGMDSAKHNGNYSGYH